MVKTCGKNVGLAIKPHGGKSSAMANLTV